MNAAAESTIVAGKNIILVTPAGDRLAIGYVERGESGRMVHQGPLVPAPWAYTHGVAAVLCADPRGRTNFANDVHVKGGERIIVDGCAYTVAIERRHWINLVPCE